MVQRVFGWERQKKCSGRKRLEPMAEKCYCRNYFSEFSIGEEKMKTRVDKRMVKLGFFSKLPFSGIYSKKISTSTFWCMIIPLGLHSVYIFVN